MTLDSYFKTYPGLGGGEGEGEPSSSEGDDDSEGEREERSVCDPDQDIVRVGVPYGEGGSERDGSRRIKPLLCLGAPQGYVF